MKKLTTNIKSVFGVIGILTAIYGALLNTRIGLIGMIFGQDVMDEVNAKMSLIYNIIPYIVFFVAFTCGALWLGYNVYNWFKKKVRKEQGKDDVRSEIIASLENIIELIKKL